MHTILIGLGMLAVAAVATPRSAEAGVAVRIGLPGFELVVAPPPVVFAPPPVVYRPPVVVAAPPVVYRPAYYPPRPVYYEPRCRDRGRHRGRYKHRGYWDD